MDASVAKEISNKSSTPNSDKADLHLMKIFVKIGRAARKGETHIHHKFLRWFDGISKRERVLVIDQLVEHGYFIGRVRRATDAHRISW